MLSATNPRKNHEAEPETLRRHREMYEGRLLFLNTQEKPEKETAAPMNNGGEQISEQTPEQPTSET